MTQNIINLTLGRQDINASRVSRWICVDAARRRVVCAGREIGVYGFRFVSDYVVITWYVFIYDPHK